MRDWLEVKKDIINLRIAINLINLATLNRFQIFFLNLPWLRSSRFGLGLVRDEGKR